jgi:arabinan endo-1,5-alpha-L-arabinosidase
VRRCLLLLLVLAGCASVPEPEHTNPALDHDFPDPAVLRTPDGWYYAYATQTKMEGRTVNIQVARSRDLRTWRHLGDALPEKPRWAAGKQNFWAPHVIHDGDAYYMYYSAEPDAAQGRCLGAATAVAPGGPFTDSGAPLLCGQGVEHIDPMAFDDPRTGRRLLYWGSGPIRVQELAADRLRLLPGSTPIELIQRDPQRPYRRLVEGAWVIFRQGYYYLFFSGDRCCDQAPRYAVMVARSRNALGPFEELEPPVLEKSDAWLAPGHNSVAVGDDGSDWIVYHAIDARRHAARLQPGVERVMLIDRLEYADGWPRIVRR